MPEGDTIFRAARTLHQALAGKTVTRFETVLPKLARVDDQQPIAGRRIQRVESAGKNLIIAFSGDLYLRTHMRMSGSWHVYRPGERWQRRRDDMRIVIATEDFVAVGFNVPVAEFHDERSLARNDDLRLIGPDLLGTAFDMAETSRRMRARPQSEIGQVLLNQRVVAGVGNVYKSEVLFLAGVNPFATIEALTDEALERIIAVSREVLQRNTSPDAHQRRTTPFLNPDQPLWVYGRGRLPCRKCGTAIEVRAQGSDARLTFWCSRCQV